MKKDLLGLDAPTWGLGSIGALIGGMAYMLPSLIATLTKGKAMTAMEKALGNLVAMLWQRITEYEEKIEKLQKERDERPIQAQQSVLLLAARGPDGVAKVHPCKAVVVAYRGTVLLAGKYGRPLAWGEKADSFMSLDRFAHAELWKYEVEQFFNHYDSLPKHFLAHLLHGTEILGFKHPDEMFRKRWGAFYLEMVDAFHLHPETEAEMDKRLGDWGRESW